LWRANDGISVETNYLAAGAKQDGSAETNYLAAGTRNNGISARNKLSWWI
jgi:hypothetical protein